MPADYMVTGRWSLVAHFNARHGPVPVDVQHEFRQAPVERQHDVEPAPSDVPYGTLDLMVLKTLASMGSLHGYGIARRIEQLAQGALTLNQGTIHPALLRLEQKGWVSATWGTSENNRRARFYSITRAGRKQLALEEKNWARTVSTVNRLLEEDA
jgi:transcriptional regulator